MLDVPCYERRYRCSYAEVGVYLMYVVSGFVESWQRKKTYSRPTSNKPSCQKTPPYSLRGLRAR